MAKYYKIRGARPLSGSIKVGGAKNTLPKNIVASLLTDEPCVISNVSNIGDVTVTLDMCSSIGTQCEWLSPSTIRISTPQVISGSIHSQFSGINRIPILMLGPLLHRFGMAEIPLLGGCKIGPRPINFHIDALRALGAEVQLVDGKYRAEASKLRGTTISLPYPSVGATETILLSASLAEGTTVIKNAAIEPEVIDLIAVLQKMGAIIAVDVDRTILIDGVRRLRSFKHHALTDRIEVASWACAAIATGGDVVVENADQLGMMAFLNIIRKIGAEYEVLDNGIRFFSQGSHLNPTFLETDVHPGFMTDWQQPFVILMTQAEGLSVLHETVYEDRFGYTDELRRMGAEIQVYKQCLGGKPCRFLHRNYPHSCVIKGRTNLKGIEMTIPDLRAGFSYIIAALVARGESIIKGVNYIERGYDSIPEKARSLGADFEVVEC
ncbi:MAG: UDP-N-acetylglucosamine 1-carboxyvinyltransferase [bacterium]|nr:UDP-N-acetylglucosamine 1-carboxyvinyltransferase [bacterium]